MGTDLSVVNAAYASFAKKATEMGPRQKRLIRFLAEQGHTSPSRHAFVRFEVESTLEERIWWESGYRKETSWFYRNGMVFKPRLIDLWRSSDSRRVGGRAIYRWRWTASLQAAVRFIQEFRDAEELESMRQFAAAVTEATGPRFPESMNAFVGWEGTPVPHEQENKPEITIPVLDHGYVHYVDHMPGEDDEERILSLEIRAPIMVRAQWFKYVRQSVHEPQVLWVPFDECGTGQGDDCDWGDPMYARNETSGRYVTWKGDPEFYIPNTDAWREKPDNGKQGSKDPLPPSKAYWLTDRLRRQVREGVHWYNQALQFGIAPEQARLFLNYAGMYTSWRWTASLAAVKFFLSQRLEHDAQWEIRQYAAAVKKIVDEVFADGAGGGQ